MGRVRVAVAVRVRVRVRVRAWWGLGWEIRVGVGSDYGVYG